MYNSYYIGSHTAAIIGICVGAGVIFFIAGIIILYTLYIRRKQKQDVAIMSRRMAPAVANIPTVAEDGSTAIENPLTRYV